MSYLLYLELLIVFIAVVLVITKDQLQLKKTIFPAYLIFFVFTFLCYMSTFFGLKILITEIIGSLWIYTAFSLVIIHASIRLGNKKTLIFYVLAFLFGTIPELIGVKYGWIFGHYYYNPALSPFILGLVPLTTAISWAVVIYMSYIFTDIIIKFGSKKPNFKSDGIIYALIVIAGLSIISGFVAVNLDMLIDPVVVATDGWFWIVGGPYYGIPMGNFMGWFLIAFLANLSFRLFEARDDPTDDNCIESPLMDTSIIAIYLMFFMIYGYSAILLSHTEYLLIGTTTMMPFIVITALLTFIRYTKVKNNG